jgi:hypothetical protein
LCVHDWGGEGQDVTHPLFDREFYKTVGLLQGLGLVDYLAFLSGRKNKIGWYAEAVALTEFGVEFVTACDSEVRAVFHEECSVREQR